jgi:hemin uptake protein HemP
MLKPELNIAQITVYKVIQSDDLFKGAREIVIKHRSEVYRLRVTNMGKLILTK